MTTKQKFGNIPSRMKGPFALAIVTLFGRAVDQPTGKKLIATAEDMDVSAQDLVGQEIGFSATNKYVNHVTRGNSSLGVQLSIARDIATGATNPRGMAKIDSAWRNAYLNFADAIIGRKPARAIIKGQGLKDDIAIGSFRAQVNEYAIKNGFSLAAVDFDKVDPKTVAFVDGELVKLAKSYADLLERFGDEIVNYRYEV